LEFKRNFSNVLKDWIKAFILLDFSFDSLNLKALKSGIYSLSKILIFFEAAPYNL